MAFSKEKSSPRKLILVVVILASAILISYLAITNQPEENTTVIEDGDLVYLSYELWIDDDDGLYSVNDVDENFKDWLRIAPDHVVLGFYKNVLGKTVGDLVEFTINRCSDLDDDGKDDVSGMDCLGVGQPGHRWYNKTLHFKVVIFEIQK